MSVTPSRPDPASPAAVAAAGFATVRKGFDPDGVRELLRAVATEMSRLQDQVAALERELQAERARPRAAESLDIDTLTSLLGEETARIVAAAVAASDDIRRRAEEGAATMLREASDQVARLRADAEADAARIRQAATADATAEVESARQHGREMVSEARAYRERVLDDVARRRELARSQIEQIAQGRERLVAAFERAHLAAAGVLEELSPFEEEPDEVVNLANTTGPVPLLTREEAARIAAEESSAETRVETQAEAADAVPEEASGAGLYDVEDETDEDWTVEVSGAHAAADEPVEEQAVSADDATEGEVGGDAVAPTPDSPAVASVDDAPVSPAAVDTAESTTGEGEDATVDQGGELIHLRPQGGAAGADEDDHEGPTAPVVALFAGEVEAEPAAEPAPGEQVAAKASVDDLFAKLRRASAEMVAQEAASALAAQPAEPPAVEAGAEPVERTESTAGETEHGVALGESESDVAAEATEGPTIFSARDEALVPVIVSVARRLKRVLADEQNDVLDALRRAKSVDRVEVLLPAESEQAERYLSAVKDDLRRAAEAGARSLCADAATVKKAMKDSSLLAPVDESFTSDVVRPLRERLDRAVMQVGEDPSELASLVRNVYREWKTQRIDEHVEDLVRLAHGRGAFASLAPGTGVCWRVDPNGPACADAEDNALAGELPAGEEFPTGHVHPPAHAGCRCLLESTPG